MKKILFSIFLTALAFNVFSQIRGTVLDFDQHTPLSNASIWISGVKAATSDKNGAFSLECRDSLEISVSYIGYQTFKKKVACNETLLIELYTASNSLKEVEITAVSNPNKNLLYQPLAVDRLSETELKRGNGLMLADAININVPGVQMASRTFSAGQQFNIRGYGNGARGTNGINSNFDGQGYKVYLNGIPVTDAEGITLMDDLDFASIGNVEVVKGPSGTLYGQAIAGVVNLRSVLAKPGKTAIGQEFLAGSYGLKRYTTTLQSGKEHASVLANYGRQEYDGFMNHTNSRKDFANVIGEFAPNEKQTIHTYVGYSNSYDARNGELTKEQYAAKDYSGNPAYIKNDAHSNVITFRAGVGHSYQFNDHWNHNFTVFGTGLSSNVSSAGGWTDKNSVNYGLRTTFDTRYALGRRIILSGITGLELQAQNAQIMGYPMVADSFNLSAYNIIGALRSNQYTISRTGSAFTEWTLQLPNSVTFTAGIGYSTLKIELNDRFYVASNNNPSNPNGTRKPSRYTNSFDGMLAPHFALNKVFKEQFSVYASYSSGYKAPVSSYFFVPLTGQVLSDLKPEYASQLELGAKGSFFKDRLTYSLAAFQINYKDKMTTVAVPNPAKTATSYVYVVNAGEQINQGIELALRAVAYKSDRFIKSFNPFVNFNLTHNRYGDNFKFQQLSADKKSTVELDFSKKVVAGVPPLTINAGFDLFAKMGLYLNMTYSYRDKMYYTSDNLNQTDVYKLLNAKIGFSHTFSKHIGVDLYVGANNLTGNQNYMMVFLNQLPDAYLPAPKEVNYFGGINLKYIF